MSREAFACLGLALLLAATLAGCSRKDPAAADASGTAQANSPEAIAWERVLAASKSTPRPESWRTNPPNAEQWREFRAQQAGRLMESSLVAREFHTRFPAHSNAPDAMGREFTLVEMAANLGDTKAAARLAEIEDQLLADPTVDTDQRFQLRLQRLRREVARVQAETDAARAMEHFATAIAGLRVEFPAQPEVYSLLLQVAEAGDSAQARAVTADVLAATAATAATKERAAALRKKLDREGQPLALKFRALDGRDIDLAQFRGKVVLIDFWATWCGPCVAELPNVKALYARHREQGFEILGISLDNSREKLEAFLKQEQIPWPQAFDGKGWENELSQGFEITGIPTLWLVDKRGVVRDVFARHNLAAKVARLLAE